MRCSISRKRYRIDVIITRRTSHRLKLLMRLVSLLSSVSVSEVVTEWKQEEKLNPINSRAVIRILFVVSEVNHLSFWQISAMNI